MHKSHRFIQRHFNTIGLGWLIASIALSFFLTNKFTYFTASQELPTIAELSSLLSVFLILSSPVWVGFLLYNMFVKTTLSYKGKVGFSLFMAICFVLYGLAYNFFFSLPLILASVIFSLTAWSLIILFYSDSFPERLRHLALKAKTVTIIWLALFSIGAAWVAVTFHSEDITYLQNQLIMGNAINKAHFTTLCKQTITEKYPGSEEQLQQFVEKNVCRGSASQLLLASSIGCQKKTDSALCLNQVCDELYAGQYRQEVFVTVHNDVRMEVCKLNMPIQKEKDASVSVTLG